MISYRRRERVIAAGLTALSGYVDAMGFIALGGYFVSFMSGNSTRLGVGLESAWSKAALPAALIGLFVAGVMLGTLIGQRARHRRPSAVVAVVALLLGIAAICHDVGLGTLAIMCMALAMGAENTVFERNGEVTIGLTYMTGTLVKLGQRITAALLGQGDRLAWAWYLMLWLGLVMGTLIGTRVYTLIGLDGLWFAALAAAALGLAAHRYINADEGVGASAQR
ncbi:hypothetical protein S4A8_14694 [Salinisphaera sp. S4-8]|uniref:YoaK family protein n=1 Tax=Salinisphaera sp. S4-8 TaxID=633357 RepID=UPI0033401B62